MYNTKKNKNKKTSGISPHSPYSIIYILSLVLAQDSTPGFIHIAKHLRYQQVFVDVRSARLSAEGKIRTRGVGIMPQTPARKKKTHTVIRPKNPKHVMDFTSLSWFYSHPLQQSTFTVKETAQIIVLPLP